MKVYFAFKCQKKTFKVFLHHCVWSKTQFSAKTQFTWDDDSHRASGERQKKTSYIRATKPSIGITPLFCYTCETVKHSHSCLKTLPLAFITATERLTGTHEMTMHAISSFGRQTCCLLLSTKTKQRQRHQQWGILQKWPTHPANICSKGCSSRRHPITLPVSRSSWQQLALATSQCHGPAVLEQRFSCWLLIPGKGQSITPWTTVHNTAYGHVTIHHIYMPPYFCSQGPSSPSRLTLCGRPSSLVSLFSQL